MRAFAGYFVKGSSVTLPSVYLLAATWNDEVLTVRAFLAGLFLLVLAIGAFFNLLLGAGERTRKLTEDDLGILDRKLDAIIRWTVERDEAK